MSAITLYVAGDSGFDQNWADASPSEQAAIQQQIENTVAELARLDWNVYILAFLHVHAQTLPMQLVYNGTPIGKLYPGLGAQLAKLKAAGKRLLISIGGWDNACDFSGIQTVGVSEFLAAAREQVLTPLWTGSTWTSSPPRTPGTTVRSRAAGTRCTRSIRRCWWSSPTRPRRPGWW
jgi:hypothetical protein